MSTLLDKKTEKAWHQLETLLVIESERDYRRARRALDELVDEVGGDERHPNTGLMDTLGTLVHAWEESHHPVPKAAPRKILAFLIEEHGLKQKDLKEVGSQGIVSEFFGNALIGIAPMRPASTK